MIKKTNRKVPQSVKVKRRIDDALAEQIADKELQHLKELQQRDNDIKGLTIQVNALNSDLESQKQLEGYIQGVPVAFVNNSTFVHNWRDSWKWISTWCFALIAFFAAVDIPPEALAVLPDNIRSYVITFTAFCGLLGRYLKQSEGF